MPPPALICGWSKLCWSRCSHLVKHVRMMKSSTRPGYNYGLSGKGKSKRLKLDDLPVIKGEVLYGLHSTFLALRAEKRKLFHCLYADSKFEKQDSKETSVGQVIELARQLDISVEMVSKKVLDQLSGNRPHQGVCIDADKLEIPLWNEEDSLDGTSGIPVWLLLHNIQDPMNFGAIMRSAYYLGLDKIIVPGSESCKPSPVVSKASSGAMEVIDMLKLPDQNAAETKLCKWWQSQDGEVVGTGAIQDDPHGKCVALNKFTVTKPTMLILGNEGRGMGEELEHCCDRILMIPGHQTSHSTSINSLNVSVAAGILLHWIKYSSIHAR